MLEKNIINNKCIQQETDNPTIGKTTKLYIRYVETILYSSCKFVPLKYLNGTQVVISKYFLIKFVLLFPIQIKKNYIISFKNIRK